jgi:hypothetical protein
MSLRTVAAYMVLSMLLGLIPAAIAHRKGQPFVGWWIYGALFIVIALPHAIFKRRANVDSSASERSV